MDILEWVERELDKLMTLYESCISTELKSKYRDRIGDHAAFERKLRELHCWQPGPPPADPEDGTCWEVELHEHFYFTRAHRGKYRSCEGGFLTAPEEVTQHRRIMPAPGEV